MDTTHTQFIASIILPLMLLICTAVYTVINYKMLKESKATRLQKITPNIVRICLQQKFTEAEH